MLGRGTFWRQGHILTHEDAVALALVAPDTPHKRIAVISHDCDLSCEKEAFVEVIVGTLSDTTDNGLIAAKNPRCLHLRYNEDEPSPKCLELRHLDKQNIAVDVFSKIEINDTEFILLPDERRALQQWLAARYGRPAFPDRFEEALRTLVGRKSVEAHIAAIMSKDAPHFLGLFFDLGVNRFQELSVGEAYDLRISLAYDTAKDAVKARIAAEKAAVEIQKICREAFGDPKDAQVIAVESCVPVAETHFTLADLRRVDQWRLEYISLRQDPAGEFVGTGAVAL